MQLQWAVLAVAALVNVRSLSVGLLADDLIHERFIRGQLAGAPGAFWDMFDICGRNGPLDIVIRVMAGMLPWWSAPDLKIAFFRPLAAVTHFADYLLWHDHPWLMHVHNLAWYLLTVLAVTAIYRRSLSVPRAAAFASVLYAIDDAHAHAVVWLAGRNTLMTAAFGALGLLAHLRGRSEGWRPGPWLTAGALALGLASSEGAVALWAYLAAHALLVDRAPWASRLRALAPAAVVTVAWRVVWGALGYGVRGSGIYRDPVTDPVSFLLALPERLPGVLVEQLALPLALDWLTPPALHHGLWIAALAIVAAVLAWAVIAARSRPMLAFWLVGMLGALLAVCTLGVAPRLLFIPGIGGFALLGELLEAALAKSAPRRGFLAALGVVVALAHGAVPLVVGPLEPDHARMIDAIYREASRRVPEAARAPGKLALILNTPSYLVSAMEPWYRAAPDEGPPPVYIFGVSQREVRVERPTSDTLVLSTEGGYLREVSSQLVRAPELRFVVGTTVWAGPVAVTVDAVTDDGRPARVRLRAKLEHPSAVWLAWQGQGYGRVALPAVGESFTLPAYDGPR